MGSPAEVCRNMSQEQAEYHTKNMRDEINARNLSREEAIERGREALEEMRRLRDEEDDIQYLIHRTER